VTFPFWFFLSFLFCHCVVFYVRVGVYQVSVFVHLCSQVVFSFREGRGILFVWKVCVVVPLPFRYIFPFSFPFRFFPVLFAVLSNSPDFRAWFLRKKNRFTKWSLFFPRRIRFCSDLASSTSPVGSGTELQLPPRSPECLWIFLIFFRILVNSRRPPPTGFDQTSHCPFILPSSGCCEI